MQFRFAHPDEIPSIARLVAHSFIGRSHDFWTEQLRDPAYGGGKEALLVGYSNDTPIASLELYPLRQWIAGQALPMAGVGTVTVAPTHRQKGVAGELMAHALRTARERGDVASALYPFRISFYQKMGYGLAGTALQYLVPPDALPPSEERDRIELLETEAQQREAMELYSAWIRDQNGQIARNDQIWSNKFKTPDTAWAGYRNKSGSLKGYANVVYRADLPVKERYLEVSEMVWTTDAAFRALIGWLASLGDQWQRIMLRGLPSHHLGDIIRDPVLPPGSAPAWGLWAPSATHMIGPMFRLLDLPNAFQHRRSAAGPVSVGFEVRDGQIEENRGPWGLRLDSEGAELTRGGRAEMTLRLDISTLSRLYIGALRPSVALTTGLMECDRPDRLAALDAALALPEPWMFDRF